MFVIVKSVDVFYIDSSEFVHSGGLNLSWHMYVPKSSCSNTVRVGFNALCSVESPQVSYWMYLVLNAQCVREVMETCSVFLHIPSLRIHLVRGTCTLLKW